MIRPTCSAVVMLAAVLGLGGCRAIRDYQAQNGNPFEGTETANAVIHPTAGNTVPGTVQFKALGKAMVVEIHLQGLTPGRHGIHIHEFGDCSAADGASAGGHYNPEGHPHALPEGEPVANMNLHAGDLGNIEANEQGVVNLHNVIEEAWFSIAGAKNPILGRAVIVHANPDDGGQPTGNAGPRVGCGVIGLSK